MQGVNVVGQKLVTAGVGLVDELFDFLVNQLGCFLAVVLVLYPFAADEDLLAGLAHGNGANGRAHAPFAHHPAGNLCHALDVVGSACGHITKDDLLGNAAAEHNDHIVAQKVPAVAVPVFLGQLHGHAQGLAPGNDAHLVDRVGSGKKLCAQGVSALMVGCDALFLIGEDETAALASHDDLVLCVFKVVHVHEIAASAGCLQGCLIHEVFEIGSGKARCACGNDVEVHIPGKWSLLGVDDKNLLAAGTIRSGNHNLAVKAAGTQKGRIEHVRTVGRGDDDDTLVGLETIHFHQHLVQRLLALVVAAAYACTPVTTYGIDFVNKDDTGSVLLALFEEISHARGAHAHEHLHKIRAGHGEKGHASLAGYGPGKQGLACAWRAHEQNALGNTAAKAGELLGVGEEFHHFHEFFLGLVHACHIGKGHTLLLVLVEKLGPGFAEGHGPAASTSAHLPHKEEPQAYENEHGQPGNEHGDVPGLIFGRLSLYVHLVFQKGGNKIVVSRNKDVELLAVNSGGSQVLSLYGHLGYAPGLYAFEKVAVGNALGGLLGLLEHVEHHHHAQNDDSPHHEIA